MEQIDDTLFSFLNPEEIVKVVQTVPQERCQHCIVEQIGDFLVPYFVECTLGEIIAAVRLISQERLQKAVP